MLPPKEIGIQCCRDRSETAPGSTHSAAQQMMLQETGEHRKEKPLVHEK